MKSKRLLSVALSLALVFTTVFAGAGSAYANTAKENAEPQVQVEEGVMKTGSADARKASYTVPVGTKLNCTNVQTSKTTAASYKSQNMPVGSYWLTSVTPKNDGMMYLDVKVTGADEYDSVEVYYVAPGTVKEVDGQLNWNYYLDADDNPYYWYVYAGERLQTYSKPIPVEGGEACQFLVVYDTYNSEQVKVDIRAKAYTTQGRSLSQGSDKWTIVSGMNRSGNTSTTYFKVKPDRTGVMNVSLKEYGYNYSTGNITLCNADKKARSEKVSYNSNVGTVKFGVKKNTTYYLKVTNCKGSYDEFYRYGIKYTMSSGTDRAIGSKSSAKQIYRKGDSISSTFVAANANSVDWYKFKVTTARSTKITVKNQYMSSAYTTMRLYKSNGTLIKKLQIPAGYEGYISSTKLAKGTYYVKITKSLKNSGKYSIKWTY